MSWREFSSEELTKLKKNPYVKSATTKMIRFTLEFKEEFWERYQGGISPTAIVTALGFDAKILGATRINGILQHIKDAAESGEGFRDHRQQNVLSASIDDIAPSKALIRMQHELSYMKQELEFVKKIILADREVSRKCSSKGDRTSNSESSEK